MAPQIIFRYQSPDSTAYLNQRLASLITKGVYDGGTIAPLGGGSLSATRLPFLAVGKDGITIADSESATVTYTASVANYHCLLAKYNPYGTPSTPVLSELILTASGYATHPDKAYLILLAVVTPTTEVLLAHIDYSARDSIGPFGHAWLKGTVATTANLPEDSPTVLVGNKVGDLYLVLADWGLYVWTGAMWRLTAAMGAATLDGAYDDNNGTAIPGAGRFIVADAGAVEIIQSTASQRQNDYANAALRINKTGSTTYGDGGLDIMVREGFDLSSILIRQAYQQGTDVQFHEPIDIMGPNQIVALRAGVDWSVAIRPNVLLVEVAGSALGNDGLYLVDITGATSANTRLLNGSPTSFVVEPGLRANFYAIRFSTGSATSGYHYPTYADLGTVSVGSVESWGNYGDMLAIGKIWYVEKDTLGYVFQVRRVDPSVSVSSTVVSYIDQYGAGYFSSHTGPGTTGQAVTGDCTVAGGLGVRGNAIAAGSIGVYGYANNTSSMGVVGECLGVGGIGVVGYGDSAGVDGITFGGAGTVGVRGIQSGDPDGYGVFGYGTGGSIGVYGINDVNANPGVKGVGRATDSIGVFGEHNPPAGEAGYGVVGWNNHVLSDGFTYPAVDGFAFGNAPGVRGQSVFGTGVYGATGVLSFDPGVRGDGFWGPGVKGISTFGKGVIGSSFGYDTYKSLWINVPLGTGIGDNYGGEAWKKIAGVNNVAWISTVVGDNYLYLMWNDFTEGSSLMNAHFNMSYTGGPSTTCFIYAHHYRFALANQVSGTGDSITYGPTWTTLVDAGASFPASGLPGQTIQITGCSNAANDGTFMIAARDSATQIRYYNSASVTETSAFNYFTSGKPSGVSATTINSAAMSIAGTYQWYDFLPATWVDETLSHGNIGFLGFRYISTIIFELYTTSANVWLHSANANLRVGVPTKLY
jgi:hypothetical protein